MPADTLTPERGAELLRRQADLQREASEVQRELDLAEVLGRVGRIEPIGSAASGLMVWRDLDLSIFCESPEPAPVADALRQLLARPGTLELEYLNETGPRSPSGGVHDQRYYAVLRYESAAGELWKIDLSFWTDAGPRGEFLDSERLRSRLDDETRLAILWIKDTWVARDDYPDEVGGIDVYDAVLNHGVRVPSEFEAHLAKR